MKTLRTYAHALIFIGILLLAFVLRIAYINAFPTWIGDEELELIMNAKSIFLTGFDMLKTWSPFDASIKTHNVPPGTYLFLIPFVGPLPFSPIAAKLPFIIVHLSILVSLYFITKKIIGKIEALVAMGVMAINPWSFFFSRTVFDAPLAIAFYLCSWVIILYGKTYQKLFALLPLYLAFQSYAGTKLILVPFVLGICLYTWSETNKTEKKNNIVPLFLIVFSSILLFSYQVITIQSEKIGERIGELALPTSDIISDGVNTERRMSINNTIAPLMSNKYTVYGKLLIGKYAEVFSPLLLFVQGEHRSTYSLYTHGYFYYIDVIFILAGFFFLFKKKTKVAFLLLYLLVIGAIPAVISKNPSGLAALRAALMYPIFSIIIGSGITGIAMYGKKKWRMAAVFCIALLYFISLINLLYIYFFRYPIYASEAYGFSKKILVSYINIHQKTTEEPIIIYTRAPETLFRHYIFTNNLLTKETSDSIAKLFKQPIINYGNMIIVNCEKQAMPRTPFTTIVESDFCEKNFIPEKKQNNFITISQLGDSGGMYKIYGDNICFGKDIKPYLSQISFTAITNGYTDTDIFCKTFLTVPLH